MPYKDKKRGHERKREYYAECVKASLCVKCRNPVSMGSVYCNVCLFKAIMRNRIYRRDNHSNILERKRKYRQFNLENGKCYKCGAPLIEDEIKYCFPCQANTHVPQIKGVLI